MKDTYAIDTYSILDADGPPTWQSPSIPDDVKLEEIPSVLEMQKPIRVQKAPGSSKELIPHYIRIAWERLKRKIREHCEHPAREPSPCTFHGETIEFQSEPNTPQILLIQREDLILKCLAGTEEGIRIVRLKTKGVGFEFRRHRYSATRLVIEIVHEARMTAGAKMSL